MNEIHQAMQFCEQCGAHLGKDVKFCESCGHPVPEGLAPPAMAVPASRDASGKWAIMAVGALGLVLLIGLSGWWLGRGHRAAPPDQAPAAQQQGDPAESYDDADDPAHVIPARETDGGANAVKQPSQPATGATPLPTWLKAQAWFRALGKSMPPGVSLSIAVEESEDPRWEIIQIREIHSPESGYDPQVSPTVGIFRVSADRASTEWLDPVINDWDSTRAFLLSREIGTARPAPAASNAASAEVYRPARGSSERTAICDAMRAHIIRDNRDRALPKFLFKIEFIRVSGDHAGFQGYPVKPDGTSLAAGAFGDMVYTALLKKRNGVWKVVVDLSRSDVPTAGEVREIRQSIPAGFPSAVMPEFWRNLLKP